MCQVAEWDRARICFLRKKDFTGLLFLQGYYLAYFLPRLRAGPKVGYPARSENFSLGPNATDDHAMESCLLSSVPRGTKKSWLDRARNHPSGKNFYGRVTPLTNLSGDWSDKRAWGCLGAPSRRLSCSIALSSLAGPSRWPLLCPSSWRSWEPDHGPMLQVRRYKSAISTSKSTPASFRSSRLRNPEARAAQCRVCWPSQEARFGARAKIHSRRLGNCDARPQRRRNASGRTQGPHNMTRFQRIATRQEETALSFGP